MQLYHGPGSQFSNLGNSNTRNLNKLATDIERIKTIDKLIDELEFEKTNSFPKYLSYFKNEDRIKMFCTTDSFNIHRIPLLCLPNNLY